MFDLSRRGFLAGILAASIAPAILKSGIIMPIKPRLILGDGIALFSMSHPRNIAVATVNSTGSISLVIKGRDQYGQYVIEHLNMTEGQGHTKKEFWSITEIHSVSWDGADVSICDGLGNKTHVIPSREHSMRLSQAEIAIISDTQFCMDTRVSVLEDGHQIPILNALDPKHPRFIS